MSIAVALDALAAEVAKRGPGYLLTSVEGGRPHVMQLQFTVDGTRLRAGVGRSAAANIGRQPAVTLLWPPLGDGSDHGAYSLIVDATAAVEADQQVTVTPTGAVLHRPA